MCDDVVVWFVLMVLGFGGMIKLFLSIVIASEEQKEKRKRERF